MSFSYKDLLVNMFMENLRPKNSISHPSCAEDAAAHAITKLHLLQKYCFWIVDTSFQYAQLISIFFHVASMRPGQIS
jgi:hypothetical protein